MNIAQSLRDIDASLSAQSAKLYRNRWRVDLFKWIKQHLHIKSFPGTSTAHSRPNPMAIPTN